MNGTDNDLAVVGTGWAAEMIATAAATLRRASLAFVVSRRPETAAAFAARFNIRGCRTSIDDLPPPHRCPLVVVCTPPASASRIAARLLCRGHFVLLEKPGATSVEAFQTIDDRAAPARARLAIAYQLQHDRHCRLAKRLIDRGRLGQVQRAFLKMHLPCGTWSDCRRQWALGADAPSAWLEAGVHLIALSLWLFGPATVIGVAAVRKADQIVAGTALLRHASGVVSTIDVSYLSGEASRRGGIEVQGSDGCLTIDRGTYRDKRTALIVETRTGCVRTTSPRAEDGTRRLLARMIQRARGADTIGDGLVGYQDALAILRLVARLERG
jgi:predicted dehydrogenase